MKRLRLIIALIVILFTTNSFSQLADGFYTYSNSEVVMTFRVCRNGQMICNYEIKVKGVVKMFGSGEWHLVNVNTADDDYLGPDGWYEIITSNNKCATDFSIVDATKIKLSRTSCEILTKDNVLVLK